MNKKNRIALRVTDEEFKAINSNAEAFGLPTGTYLRLLGIGGGNPFMRKSQARVVMDASGYEGLEVQRKDHGEEKPNPRRKRVA